MLRLSLSHSHGIHSAWQGTAQDSLKAMVGMWCLPGYTCCGSWAPERATDSWSRTVKCTDFFCLPSIHVPRYGTEGFFRFYDPFSILTLCEQCPQKYPSTLDVSDFIPFSLSVCQVMQKIWPWMMTELLSLLSIYFKVWVTDGRNKEAQADTNDN